MWRSTVFPENENSDQSISEDDDLNEDSPEDHVSLGVPAAKKGEVQILSQLDMLKGADVDEVMHQRDQTSLLQKRQADIGVEDDVEFPFFANKCEFTYTPQNASACNSDEEILSDNEVRGNCMQSSKGFTSEADNYQKIGPSSFGVIRKDGVCTWLAADAIGNVNNNVDSTSYRPVSARAKRLCKGGEGKAKRKFSFRTHSHNDLLLKEGKEMDELKNKSAEKPVSHTHTTTSMAELLIRIQDEHDLPEGSTMKYSKTKGTSEQLSVKRSILSMHHGDIDDDPDCLGSDSSDEDKFPVNHQIQEPAMPDSRQKTIADQFQEALGAAATNEEGNINAVPRQTSFGLFGKLQRIIQSEKERDSYFLNQLQKEGFRVIIQTYNLSVEAR
ncbi:uncharacterized protein LOC112517674 isoform X1 [Cynara cardunculus var. scolymus]|uniref:uncharacterized protein LOC112517674 isoform X1 n=1 Tax=Cynara cardunculus var. scolymus TaxID=59895 RepID=UPI000D62A33F|nr:uncharacterized protein LOC112517674 isoform X1 [Cynara cardunculus var. scolymus]